MKVVTKSKELVFDGSSLTSEFIPPKNVTSVTGTHVVIDGRLFQVVTWIEFTEEERVEAMLQSARDGGAQA